MIGELGCRFYMYALHFLHLYIHFILYTYIMYKLFIYMYTL